MTKTPHGLDTVLDRLSFPLGSALQALGQTTADLDTARDFLEREMARVSDPNVPIADPLEDVDAMEAASAYDFHTGSAIMACLEEQQDQDASPGHHLKRALAHVDYALQRTGKSKPTRTKTEAKKPASKSATTEPVTEPPTPPVEQAKPAEPEPSQPPAEPEPTPAQEPSWVGGPDDTDPNF